MSAEDRGREANAVHPVHPFSWENLDDYTQRASVPGGWLVRTFAMNVDLRLFATLGHKAASHAGVAITFVPDPEHAWELR